MFIHPLRLYQHDPFFWLFQAPWHDLVILSDGWMVGVWTGEQGDLICVKRCETNAEAEKYLSPGAPTFTLACLASLRKAWRLGVRGVKR
jgi:hypothetical protein